MPIRELGRGGRRTALVLLTVLCVGSFILLSVCVRLQGVRSRGYLRPIPRSASILFLSKADAGCRREEIYAAALDGGQVSRVTVSDFHHKLIGIDKTGRFIVATRVERDTDPPSGLGDEDLTDIWILDTQTGKQRRLAGPQSRCEGDSFSPDGQWVVFQMVAPGEDQSDIYKIRVDGGHLTRLTWTNNASEADPAWSNEGDKIAFVSYSAESGSFVLKTMRWDGSGQKTVYVCHDDVSTPLFPPGAYDPSWSPDDRWIVFEKPVHYSGENGGAGAWHIFKVHPDGTGLCDLSLNGGHTDMAEYLPSFSPDGTHILFTARYGPSDPASVKTSLFLMDEEGSNLVQLTFGSFQEKGIWVG